MTHYHFEQSRPRIIFFGMTGSFSSVCLDALLKSGVDVCAVVVPAARLPEQCESIILVEPPARRRLTLIQNAPSIIDMAWQLKIPVWRASKLAAEQTVETLSRYQPDSICVACFSRRIPLTLLRIPRLGSLNVHPSLLPARRGPDPLYWTLRDGDEQAGVTIHLLEERLDTGAILAQEPVAVPDGITYEQLEYTCAERGAVLLVRSLWELYNGVAAPIRQDESKSSYQSFPDEDDLIIPAHEWSARRVYNIVRGLAGRYGALPVQAGIRTYWAVDALSYSHKENEEQDGEGGVAVICREGIVRLNGYEE